MLQRAAYRRVDEVEVLEAVLEAELWLPCSGVPGLLSVPDDRGGWAIDHLGPFPEGIVAWLLGGLSLVLVCMVIGKRVHS